MSDEIKPDLSVNANIVKPPETPSDFVPKTKDEWNKLKTDNPGRWADLTQANMDKTVREKREIEERLDKERQEKANLQAELDKYRQPVVPPVSEGEKFYDINNLPQTDDEWNNLFLDNPVKASDLRNVAIARKQQYENDFINTRKQAARTVQEEHPDMYIPELGDDGTPKKDAKGQIVLKLDNFGQPIFNPDSEKGKLWTEIFNEDADIWRSNKKAPILMMSEMERRLRKGASMKVQNNSEDENLEALAPRGVPPVKTSHAKFNSVEEEEMANRAVSRGTYANIDEYIKWREGGIKTFLHSNSRPDFNKK